MPEKECKRDKCASCILVDNGRLHCSLHSKEICKCCSNGRTAAVHLARMLSTQMPGPWCTD